MITKLKPIAVEEYSKAFAKKLCNTFFEAEEVITGKQILSFCHVYQVNLFILYKLFDRWQHEIDKLRSPYFDYNAPEVSQALTVFMNTLSRHIAIRQPDFEPLVVRAVGDTLKLTLTPYDFFKSQLTHDAVVRVGHLKEMQKYVHLNKALFQELITKLENMFGQEVEWNRTFAVWDEIYQRMQNQTDPAEPVMDLFAKQVPFAIEDLVDNPRQPATPPAFKPTENLFDADLLNRYANAANANYSLPSLSDLGKDVANAKTLEPDNSFFNGSRFNLDLPDNTKKANGEDKNLPLHQLYQNNLPTLNDKLVEKNPENLVTQQRKLKIDSIRDAISLNQKFIFVGDLFGGDAALFQQVVEEIEQSPDFDQAMYLLKARYAAQFEWDFNSEAVQELMDIVERRFI
jgi:hypothetical protein